MSIRSVNSTTCSMITVYANRKRNLPQQYDGPLHKNGACDHEVAVLGAVCIRDSTSCSITLDYVISLSLVLGVESDGVNPGVT